MSTSRFENYQKGLLGSEAFGRVSVEDESWSFRNSSLSFPDLARRRIFEYVKNRLEKTDTHVEFGEDEVYLVWFVKVLKNWKALISTTLPDGMYYEVTYNGDKQETYIDAYKKFENVCIPD